MANYILNIAKNGTSIIIRATKYEGSTIVDTKDYTGTSFDIFGEVHCDASTVLRLTIINGGLYNGGNKIPASISENVDKDRGYLFNAGSVLIATNIINVPDAPAVYSVTLVDTPPQLLPEFDFYYRAKYGAEFPWPESPEPPKPIKAEIVGTKIHAETYPSNTQNIRIKPKDKPWKTEKPQADNRTCPSCGKKISDMPNATTFCTNCGAQLPFDVNDGKDDTTKEEAELSSVYDEVHYTGLIPGDLYYMEGRLYDLTAKSFITVPEYVQEFMATDIEGLAVFEFKLDLSTLEGHTIVAYIDIYTGEDDKYHWLCGHEDPKDTNEYIYVLAAIDNPEDVDDSDDPFICIVDANFNVKGILDKYESLIWTDRYDKAGDFELYTLVDPELFELLSVDNYFYIPQSDRHMIVEKIEITSDAESGDKLLISGRSLESILDRRVIWFKTVLKNEDNNATGEEGKVNLQDSILQILEDNIVNPRDQRRKLPNFKYVRSTDPKVTSLKMEAEYFGDNIYDVVCNLCQSNHIGFKIRLNAQNEFVFELYYGEDRSYDNSKNLDYIIFGPEYDNVSNSSYIENKENYKNVARVGTGADTYKSSYGGDKYIGLDRRETYITASDVDKDNYDSKEAYMNALSEKGRDELKNYQNIKSYDGLMLNSKLTYLVDYNIGDLIEFKDAYGHEDKVKIVEWILSYDKNGLKIYPSFEALEEK